MEIGNSHRLSTYEKEFYTRKAISLITTALLIIFAVSYYIIANCTSLFEQKIFSHLADKYGYELSYSNTYEVWDNDNAKQGNYIQLADRDNDIYIMFRYDETNEKLNKIIGNMSKPSSLYSITTKVDTNKKIKSEEDILSNINKEFSPLGETSVRGNGKSTGGGYSIVKLDTIMNQHRIEYTSNLLKDISEQSKKDNSTKAMTSKQIKNWFNYGNSINYQLNILKSLVETKSTDKDNSNIMYGNETGVSDATIIENVGDSTDNSSEVTDNSSENESDDTEETSESSDTSDGVSGSLDGFINNKEDILKKYGDAKYTTYTSLILSSDSKDSDSLENLFNDKKSDVSSGVIIGTCINDESSIEKMTTTMNILIVLSYLEKTILL